MKEILVGFLALIIFLMICYGLVKYKEVGIFILFAMTTALVVGMSYLIGACILGTI